MKNVSVFIQKTYKILENESFQDIIQWNEEGDAFIIYNVTQFSQIVLPALFKHDNFSSFVRQLNMYDFHKNKGSQNEFKHENFLRNRIDLLPLIKRKTQKEQLVTTVSIESSQTLNQISLECDYLKQICGQLLINNFKVLKENKSFQKKLSHHNLMLENNEQLCLTNDPNIQ